MISSKIIHLVLSGSILISVLNCSDNGSADAASSTNTNQGTQIDLTNPIPELWDKRFDYVKKNDTIVYEKKSQSCTMLGKDSLKNYREIYFVQNDTLYSVDYYLPNSPSTSKWISGQSLENSIWSQTNTMDDLTSRIIFSGGSKYWVDLNVCPSMEEEAIYREYSNFNLLPGFKVDVNSIKKTGCSKIEFNVSDSLGNKKSIVEDMRLYADGKVLTKSIFSIQVNEKVCQKTIWQNEDRKYSLNCADAYIQYKKENANAEPKTYDWYYDYEKRIPTESDKSRDEFKACSAGF